MTTTQRFFYDNAGYSYDPKTETPEQGRQRCACKLAEIEAWANAAGVRFDWCKDDITNRTKLMPGLAPEYDKSVPAYRLDQVVAWLHGKLIGALGGIDFGYRVHRNDSEYKRVVEAEICWEAFAEHEESQAMACRDIVTV